MKLLCAVVIVASGITQSDAAGQMKLDWKDCGGSTKITAFTPSTLSLGEKTTMTGTGTLDEDVTGATFDLEMTGTLGKMLSCSGDASQTKSCHLPLGTGNVTFNQLPFPLKKGASSSVNVDIQLTTSLPTALFNTKTIAKVTSPSGGLLMCLEIDTSREDEPDDLASQLDLAWKDCGGTTTITDFTPSILTTGQKTTMTGTGTLDEDCADATFDLEMTGALGKLLSCKGDAKTAKTCNLPLGTGSLSFQGVTFPMKKGTKQNVNVDIQLANSLPPALFGTKTTAKITSSTGVGLLCMEITTKKHATTVVV